MLNDNAKNHPIKESVIDEIKGMVKDKLQSIVKAESLEKAQSQLKSKERDKKRTKSKSFSR